MSFKTYPKIHAIGKEEVKDILSDPNHLIVVQEKMDGANFRFMIDEDGRVRFGSRTQELEPTKEHVYAKNFNRACAYIREKINTVEDLNTLRHKIFYGECMVKHTMDYDWSTVPPFLLFDVYDIAHEFFYDFNFVQHFAETLSIKTVPHIMTVPASQIAKIDDEEVPTSKYAPRQAEGIVFKNYSAGLFAKFVRQEFKEKNAEAFGMSPKAARELGEEHRLVATYCTNARIDKAVFKLLDEGNQLEMSLMKHLPMSVYLDMWEECWREIVTDRQLGEFSPQEVKKIITNRCKSVLNQTITNQTILSKE
jgi:hypothetical protein